MCRIVVMLASVGWAGVVAAQGGTHFGIGGSATFPVGEYHADVSGAGYNVGWQGVAFLEFAPPRSATPVAVRLEGFYGENKANQVLRDALTADNAAPTDQKVILLGGSLDLRLRSRRGGRRRAVAGYLIGGIGVTKATVRETSGDLSQDDSDTKFTWNAGAGAQLPGRSALFVEVRYFHLGQVQGFGNNYIPVTIGVRF